MQDAGLPVSLDTYSKWIQDPTYGKIYQTLTDQNLKALPTQQELNNQALVGNIKSTIFIGMTPALEAANEWVGSWGSEAKTVTSGILKNLGKNAAQSALTWGPLAAFTYDGLYGIGEKGTYATLNATKGTGYRNGKCHFCAFD